MGGTIFLFDRRGRPRGEKELAMNRPLPLDPKVALGPALLGALAALTVPACGTNEIRPDQSVVNFTPTDPTEGGLLVVVAPTAETYEQQQADARAYKNDPTYTVLIDGKELVYDDGGSIRPLVVAGGGGYGAGFHASGTHHFTFVAPGGSTAMETDGVIASGAPTRLYLFGPSDALQTRVVSFPVALPAGEQHISAINLVRSGGLQIEIVGCTDAATCAPVSPPLAFGDTFDADLPTGPASTGGSFSLSASGAGYGYRQVATASLPTPPILSMWPADVLVSPEAGASGAFLAAPVYMANDGTFLGGVP
jgi:hypothetical protein